MKDMDCFDIPTSESYVKCLTWQFRNCTEKLLSSEIFYNKYRPRRVDKTEFYLDLFYSKMPQLEEDEEWDLSLVYSFASMWDGSRNIVPINEKVVIYQADWLIRFMCFTFDRDVIELNIPTSECILGTHHGLNQCDLTYTKGDIECVTPYIKPEWLVSIHRSDDNLNYSLLWGKPTIMSTTFSL